MKKALVGAIAVASGLLLNVDQAEAGLVVNSKVTGVYQSYGSDGFGPYVHLQIFFSKPLGGACPVDAGVYRLYMVSDAALRDLGMQTMDGFRQIANAALLSGREVHVNTTGCTSSWHTITSLNII